MQHSEFVSTICLIIIALVVIIALFAGWDINL